MGVGRLPAAAMVQREDARKRFLITMMRLFRASGTFVKNFGKRFPIFPEQVLPCAAAPLCQHLLAGWISDDYCSG
jgi:hypothetical protein